MKEPQSTDGGLIVISDLDGTLLDQQTYSCAAALPAVERLRARRIPLILCSSKTAAEISILWDRLALKDPFIAENGGAIHFAPGYFSLPIHGKKLKDRWEVLELGSPIALLRRALEAAARDCGAKIRSFGAMTVREISEITGLGDAEAALSARREYDEPFLVEAGDEAALLAALASKGFAVSRGGRLFHLTGAHDKGSAARRLFDLYRQTRRRFRAVGLGDAANDLALLSLVDLPVIVRKPDGSWDPELLGRLPGAYRTREIGPKGWAEAIEKIVVDNP